MDVKDNRATMHIAIHLPAKNVKFNLKKKNAKDFIELGRGFAVLMLMIKYHHKLGYDEHPHYWTMFNRSIGLELGISDSMVIQQIRNLLKAGFIIRIARGIYQIDNSLITYLK